MTIADNDNADEIDGGAGFVYSRPQSKPKRVRIKVTSNFGFISNCHPRSDGNNLSVCIPALDDGPSDEWKAKHGAPAAANDNIIGWPLGRLLALKSTGPAADRERWLLAAQTYEGLWLAGTASIQLRGTHLDRDDFRNPDGTQQWEQYQWTDPDTGATENKGARSNRWPTSWFDEKTGAIRFKGFREYKRPKEKWDGDRALIAKLDAGPLLYEVNKALAGYRPAVEDAVVHGLTMGDIGRKLGYSPKYGQAVAKKLVLPGLDIVAAETAHLL